MRTLRAEIPEKLQPALAPSRYKALYGGRGGAKSHFFGQLAVIRNLQGPTRGVCIREVQNSIKDSVKTLIETKIREMGAEAHFEPLRDEIRGVGPGNEGSLIVFRGMQDYNADNIKSLEGFDWAWVEEAQSLSSRSWRLLRPTIRKPGSEIWCSWNPRWDTDPVDSFFRGPHPPEDAVVLNVNWHDNPWFPDELRKEMERDFAADPEMAEHVWSGGYELISEGAYYAKLIAQAEKDGRIGNFPYKPGQVVRTAFDIGVDDYTAIWFVVDDGLMGTVVDYYEASGDGADEIVAAAMPELFIPPPLDARFADWTAQAALKQLGRDVPFKYGTHFLPHDVRMREWGAGARSRVETLQTLGVKNIRKGAATNPADRIEASRRLLPFMRFNNTPRVQLGIKRLRRYSRKMNDAMGVYLGPLHDENSHGADAFGEFAINCGIAPEKSKPVVEPPKDELLMEVKGGKIIGNMNVKELVAMHERLEKRRKMGLR